LKQSTQHETVLKTLACSYQPFEKYDIKSGLESLTLAVLSTCNSSHITGKNGRLPAVRGSWTSNQGETVRVPRHLCSRSDGSWGCK